MTRSGRHNEDIAPLYEIEDETGVLDKHRNKMLGPFMEHQVDMKIMYYELIKMLMDYDKRQQSEEEYFVTNTIHKIEGYQQLTNKLQRHLNKKFLTEIGEVKTNQTKIINNIGDTNILLKLETLENNYQSLVQVNEGLVERLEALEKSASKFSDEYINNIDSRLKEFSGTNERLEKTIQMIGDNKAGVQMFLFSISNKF